MAAPTTFADLRRLIAGFSRRRKWQFAALFVLSLIGACAELVGIGAVLPFLQLIAMPDVMAKKPSVIAVMHLLGKASTADLIVPAAIALIVIAILSAAVRIVLNWATMRYVYALTHDLAMMVYSHTIRQPYSLYVTRNSAEVISGIDKVSYVGSYLILPLMQALSSGIIALAIIALLWAVDPVAATLSAVSMGLLYFLFGTLSRPALMRIGIESAYITTQRIKLTQESLGGIRDIILDRSYDLFDAQFRAVDRRGRRLAAHAGTLSVTPRFAIEAMAVALIAGLGVYYSYQQGGVIAAVPVLGALALGAQRLLPLLQAVSTAYMQYASASGLLRDVLALLDAPVVKESAAAPAPKGHAVRSPKIELRNLSFGYAKSAPALSNISLSIEPGMRVGFVGRTGSGKSTLLDIVMGLLDPDSGSILLDGAVLDEHSMPAWQSQIAHVPQSIFLTEASVAANIAFGQPIDTVDQARIEHAARRADIHDFILTLPDGYQTTVGERGVRLSGGQRQRIGIARALYKDASVLVLDEATSALDGQTETAVMENIERLDRSLTILLIAHRLSTVARCDLVVRLENGRVVDAGTYDRVVAGGATELA